VRAAIEGEITPQVTASFLQNTTRCSCSRSGGRRCAHPLPYPWRLGRSRTKGSVGRTHDPPRHSMAVAKVRKPILKLTETTTRIRSPGSVAGSRSAYEANLAGFYRCSTRSPAGGRTRSRRTKPATRPCAPALAVGNGVSQTRAGALAHPDDDVISMAARSAAWSSTARGTYRLPGFRATRRG